jgi:hypothetical protein
MAMVDTVKRKRLDPTRVSPCKPAQRTATKTTPLGPSPSKAIRQQRPLAAPSHDHRSTTQTLRGVASHALHNTSTAARSRPAQLVWGIASVCPALLERRPQPSPTALAK